MVSPLYTGFGSIQAHPSSQVGEFSPPGGETALYFSWCHIRPPKTPTWEATSHCRGKSPLHWWQWYMSSLQHRDGRDLCQERRVPSNHAVAVYKIPQTPRWEEIPAWWGEYALPSLERCTSSSDTQLGGISCLEG